MQLESAVEQFLEQRRLSGRAVNTICLYRRELTTWRRWREGQGLEAVTERIDLVELRGFFTYLRDTHTPHQDNPCRPAQVGKRLAPATIDSYWRTLRAFWRFLDGARLLTLEQREEFNPLQIPRPFVEEPPREACDDEIFDRLLAACGDGQTEHSARNRAICLLLYESGMRIAELCSMDDDRIWLTQFRARIRGKGGKWRPVFWQTRGASALARYILLRRGKSGGPQPLFRGCSSRNNGGRLTPDAVRNSIKRLAHDAGIKLPPGAPLHFLRHGFAHAALEHGADISEVSELLGHASLTTTMRYLREDEDGRQERYERIFSRAKRPARGGFRRSMTVNQ